ncbi:hypothetical protein TNCV_2796331 [Trichonephila clavipes]|nr:hypothetical protein TNCV_2796331 [Trichonephila clavipes]
MNSSDDTVGQSDNTETFSTISLNLNLAEKEPFLPQMKRFRQKRRIHLRDFKIPRSRTVTSNGSTECRSVRMLQRATLQGEQLNPAGAVDQGGIGYELLLGKPCRGKVPERANST